MSDRGSVGAEKSVLGRALGVLDAFGTLGQEQSVSSICAATDLPPATVHRILATLVEWGGVERVGRGRYRLGLHLWRLGAAVPQARILRDRALPFLEDLYEATRLVVHLAVRDGDEVLYLEKISARGAVRVTSAVGKRLPLHATGPGKVLLAYGERELLDRLLETPLPRLTRHTIVSEAGLRTALAEIRRTGVAVSREEASLGTVSVAAPIFGEPGRAIAALAVVGATGKVDVARIVPLLHIVTRGLSRTLEAHAVATGREP